MGGVGHGNGGGGGKRPLRCAVYTRKSTEEGLDQAFNSLDAQWEACKDFIASQRGEGWVLVPDRFDDGGFTGANVERPALKRLLAEIEAGRVDIVVIYKLDRLTRSIRDFGRIMDVLEGCQARVVAVTQEINTTTSMGRLMLHVLLSFAQFERETTADRTRDKMLAARRKGKWTGGYPPLGYDLTEGKLAINAEEAEQVKAIYAMYLERASLIATIEELNRRGWRAKSWTTKENGHHEGRPWSKATLRRLLTNKVYLGLVPHKNEAYPGEHPAILDEATFNRVQAVMSEGRSHGSAGTRNSFAYLLRGLVHCAVCGSAMSAATTYKGATRYRYYRCTVVDKQGTTACPVRYAPAEPLEQFVVDHLRQLGREPALVEETLQQAHREVALALAQLKNEGKTLEADARRVQAEARRVLTSKATGSLATAHLAEMEERQGAIATRLAEIETESQRLAGIKVDPIEAKKALATFDPVWDLLEPREKERLVRLVVERVDYDGVKGEIGLQFHPLGLQSLVAEAGVATSLKRVEMPVKVAVAGEVA